MTVIFSIFFALGAAVMGAFSFYGSGKGWFKDDDRDRNKRFIIYGIVFMTAGFVLVYAAGYVYGLGKPASLDKIKEGDYIVLAAGSAVPNKVDLVLITNDRKREKVYVEIEKEKINGTPAVYDIITIKNTNSETAIIFHL